MRLVDRGLVALALRRSLSLGVVAWAAALLVFTWLSGSAPDAQASDAARLADQGGSAVAAGLAREGIWLVFVLGIIPLLVLRTAASVAPWRIATQTGAGGGRGASHAAAARHGDAPWLATRAVSNATIAVSTWLGATLACLALVSLFAVAVDFRGGTSPTPVAAGTLDGPTERWAASGSSLAWHAELPAGFASRSTTVSIELGLGAGAGAATQVRLRARRQPDGVTTQVDRMPPSETAATTRIGNRGTIEVALPPGRGGVDFELACLGENARICVLSERVELWSRDAGSHAATLSIAIRLALATCAWLALALGLSPFLSSATAAFAVLAAWIPRWWSDAGPSAFPSRCLPGADLFDALSVVGDGRAPAWPGIASYAGTVAVVGLGLVLAWAGLRRWRVSR
jgi:hypothetical protein